MRPRSALLVVGVAAVVGTLLGAFVLPDRGVAVDAVPRPTTSTPSTTETPTPAASTPAASPSPSSSEGGPVSSTQLLTVADFRQVGLRVTPQRSDVRLEVVVCDTAETLDDIALSGPPVQQLWEKGSVVASEQAVAARDSAEAEDVAQRALRKLEACQHEVATHWVYGPTHTARLGAGITASWLGQVDGELNTSGKAPPGEKINGGIAVLRNGSHVAVLSLAWCASAGDGGACVVAPDGSYEQLAALSRAAAFRLN